MNVIDAVRMAQPRVKGYAKPRDELICEVLQAWADQKLAEASLIAKLALRNPDEVDSDVGGP